MKIHGSKKHILDFQFKVVTEAAKDEEHKSQRKK